MDTWSSDNILHSELLSLGFRIKKKDVKPIVSRMKEMVQHDIQAYVEKTLSIQTLFVHGGFHDFISDISNKYGSFANIEEFGFANLRVINNQYILDQKDRFIREFSEYFLSENVRPQEKRFISYGLTMKIFEFLKKREDEINKNFNYSLFSSYLKYSVRVKAPRDFYKIPPTHVTDSASFVKYIDLFDRAKNEGFYNRVFREKYYEVVINFVDIDNNSVFSNQLKEHNISRLTLVSLLEDFDHTIFSSDPVLFN